MKLYLSLSILEPVKFTFIAGGDVDSSFIPPIPEYEPNWFAHKSTRLIL